MKLIMMKCDRNWSYIDDTISWEVQESVLDDVHILKSARSYNRYYNFDLYAFFSNIFFVEVGL